MKQFKADNINKTLSNWIELSSPLHSILIAVNTLRFKVYTE
jgi:hypothetical protein